MEPVQLPITRGPPATIAVLFDALYYLLDTGLYTITDVLYPVFVHIVIHAFIAVVAALVVWWYRERFNVPEDDYWGIVRCVAVGHATVLACNALFYGWYGVAYFIAVNTCLCAYAYIESHLDRIFAWFHERVLDSWKPKVTALCAAAVCSMQEQVSSAQAMAKVHGPTIKAWIDAPSTHMGLIASLILVAHFY